MLQQILQFILNSYIAMKWTLTVDFILMFCRFRLLYSLLEELGDMGQLGLSCCLKRLINLLWFG